VLVDLGPLENIERAGDALQQNVGGELDAILLVHNRRITSEEQLTVCERELLASGMVLAGLVENFIVE